MRVTDTPLEQLEQRDFHQVWKILLELDVAQVNPLASITGQLGMLLAGVNQLQVRKRMLLLDRPERDRLAPRPPGFGRGARDDLSTQIQRMHGEINAQVRIERD